MITLDGATLEGGGQLVRVALSLSAIRCIPIRLERVRANRASKNSRGHQKGPLPGLKESHLAALNWLGDACGAKVSDVAVGSQNFTFRPPSRKGHLITNLPAKSTIELKNPGSVWLVLQALLPFIVFSTNVPSFDLMIKGGTNVSKSMSGEYVQQVLVPTLERIGLPRIAVSVPHRGWANVAGEIGEVHIQVHRTASTVSFTLPAFQIRERGDITSINVSILGHSTSIREAIFLALVTAISKTSSDLNLPRPVLHLSEPSGDARRLHVLLVARTSNGWRLGRDALYERKPKNAREEAILVEKVVGDVVGQLTQELRRGGCVDEYLADQLVIWQALAEGESYVDGGSECLDDGKDATIPAPGRESNAKRKSHSWRDDTEESKDGNEACLGDNEGTLHTRTVRWVCEQMLENDVKFSSGGHCRGVGQNVVDRRQASRDSGISTPIDDLTKNLSGADINADEPRTLQTT